ncbi:DUF1439 domain-containing protein [Pseudoalteromonas sp. MMG010]|uniref:DUF1439 domain-containing protein n=1 Tax=Pseudoalteromonas sp. MMG010 TaxID=2822685 RepID=UPI001B39FA11|nr:DUF1439 domain-containing protein [Pseudoalteromonas sp. MMG010]MBQ4832209.1 DUF1439 domain-containing protein [Pseudoalteromonas sp. MMG010]
MRALLLLATLFLSACNSTTGYSGLSFYSFSNSDVESLLADELPKLSEKITLMGLPVQLDINDMSVEIGPDNSDIVILGADTSAQLSVFALNYPIRLQLKVQGSPYYDSQQKAVFLRNVNLLDSSIDAAGYKGNISALDDQVMDIINQFLQIHPVYKLNTDDPKIALLSKLPLDMKVTQGAIKLIPAL